MVLMAVINSRPFSIGGIRHTEDSGEVLVFCPHCKAFQTVWLNETTLLPTRKFSQEGSQIYHDCGSDKPCRLYI